MKGEDICPHLFPIVAFSFLCVHYLTYIHILVSFQVGNESAENQQYQTSHQKKVMNEREKWIVKTHAAKSLHDSVPSSSSSVEYNRSPFESS